MSAPGTSRAERQAARDAANRAAFISFEKAANQPGGGIYQPQKTGGPTWADTPAGRELRKQYEQSGVVFDSRNNIIYNPTDLGSENVEAARAAQGLPPSYQTKGEPSGQYLSAVSQAGGDISKIKTKQRELDAVRGEITQARRATLEKDKELMAERDKLNALMAADNIDKTWAGNRVDNINLELQGNISSRADYSGRLSNIDKARQTLAQEQRAAQTYQAKAAIASTKQKVTEGPRPIQNALAADYTQKLEASRPKPQRQRAQAQTGITTKLYANPDFMINAKDYTRPASFQGDTRKERPKAQQGITDKLFLNPDYITKEKQRETDSTSFAFQTQPSSFAVSLVEGVPTKPKQYSQEQVNKMSQAEYSKYLAEINTWNSYVAQQEKANRQSAIDYSRKLSGFVKEAQDKNISTLIIKSEDQFIQVPTDRAIKKLREIQRKDPKATLSSPATISLTETLGVSSADMGVKEIRQDKQGHLETVVAQQAVTPIPFRPNEFIPISVKGSDVTGIGKYDNTLQMLTVQPAQADTGEIQTDVTKNIDVFSEGIERAADRQGKNPIGFIAGLGKEGYSIFPATYGLVQKYASEPLVNTLKGENKRFAQPLVYDTTPSILLRGPARGILATAEQGNLTALPQNLALESQQALIQARDYSAKKGAYLAGGELVGLVLPTGVIKSPFSIGRAAFEVLPEAGLKSTKYTVTATAKAGPISKSFSSYEKAETYAAKLVQRKEAQLAQITAVQTPIKSLQFVGKPIISKVADKYVIGGPTRAPASAQVEAVSKLSPTGRGLEIGTQTKYARDYFTSEQGLTALRQAEKITERDPRVIELLEEASQIIGKERRTIGKTTYPNLTGLESLKTPAEQKVLMEQVLPKSKVPVKGAAAQITQVRPEIIGKTPRQVTGDIDRDFQLFKKLKKVGLKPLSESLSYRAAQKDIAQAQEKLQAVAEPGREFVSKGTKLYAKEGEKQEKVLENLTEKGDITPGGSPTTDFSQVFGAKYKYDIVKQPSPEGRNIKYRGIVDQTLSKFTSVASIQGPRTEKFAGEGAPDFLKTGKEIPETAQGFGVSAPPARLKDTYDAIKLDIPELGQRLIEKGKTKQGQRLLDIGKELERQFPEIDFSTTKPIKEADAFATEEIPSALSRSGITPRNAGRIGVAVTAGSASPISQESQARSVSRSAITGSASRSAITSSATRSSITSSASKTIPSAIRSSTRPSNIRSTLSETRSTISQSKASPIRSTMTSSSIMGTSGVAPRSAIIPSPTRATSQSRISPITQSPISPVVVSPIIPIKSIIMPKPVKPLKRVRIPKTIRPRKTGKTTPPKPTDFLGNASQENISTGYNRQEIYLGIKKTARIERKDLSKERRGVPRFSTNKSSSLLVKAKPNLIRAEKKRSPLSL